MAGVSNVVLVHGAWADGSSWAKVIPLLEKAGLNAVAVQNPLTSLADDVAATKRAIARLDGQVILVGHSYGGAVISEGGNDPKVVGLVYIAAFAPDVGEAVGELGKELDVLGFSIGGYIAQSLVLRYPDLVRRLVLAGTAPRNGELANDPRIPAVAANPIPTLEDFLFLFFTPSAASQAAGKAFWQRRHQRNDADPPSSAEAMKAQSAAIAEFREPRGERYSELRGITQPTLVMNGKNDIMVPTINSFTLCQHIPNAQLIIYPDSGHGALFQYPKLFVTHTTIFHDS